MSELAQAPKIYHFRDQHVMLSSDLAALYGVPTMVLMQSVRRNIARFPEDFAFQLDADEFAILKSQSVISSWGGNRKPPYAFTEQGIAMLSGVLNSERAIEVNIQLIRMFVQMRRDSLKYADLARRLEAIEDKLGEHSQEFQLIYSALRQLAEQEETPNRKIGFRQVRENRKRYPAVK